MISPAPNLPSDAGPSTYAAIAAKRFLAGPSAPYDTAKSTSLTTNPITPLANGRPTAGTSTSTDTSRGTSTGKGTGTMVDDRGDELYYRPYASEDEDLDGIMRLCEQELSEPYTLYTFRYFLVDWPHLTFLVFPSVTDPTPIAVIVCKQDSHKGVNRGYIAMLSVDRAWRRRGIASNLVKRAIVEMIRHGAHEIVLETEYDNASSIALYESLGFMREKRLYRFYSNAKDAFRLIYPLPSRPHDPPPMESPEDAENGRWAVGSGPAEELELEPGLSLGTIAEELPPAGRDSPRPPPLPLRPWEGLYT